jgi:CcmD family protein
MTVQNTPISSNWNFVAAAYAAVWIAISAYWWYVHRTLKAARARYEQALRGERK